MRSSVGSENVNAENVIIKAQGHCRRRGECRHTVHVLLERTDTRVNGQHKCTRLDREDCLKCTPRRARDVGEGIPKMRSAREPGSM